MTTANFPQVGDRAVDLRTNGRPNGRPDRAGDVVTVKAITASMVLTSDGERYNRASLKPVSEGRYSDRQLVPPSDLRVLVVRGRAHLVEVARLADNISKLDHDAPEDILAGLARIIMAASDARRQVVEIMREASKTEQESPR